MGDSVCGVRNHDGTSVFDGPHQLKYGLRLGNGVDFCIGCNRISEYYIREVPDEMTIRGITFHYKELRAICCFCHEEIYIPEVNDWNVDRREAAFFSGLFMISTSMTGSFPIMRRTEGIRMRMMTKRDLRDALIVYLRETNDMVWDNRDDDRDLANTAFYKQGVMEFFAFLEDKMDEEV